MIGKTVLATTVLATALLTTFGTTGAGAAVIPYRAFGNFTIDDCQYESGANLVLHEDPQAQITTNEVLGAYRANGYMENDGSPAGLDYLENVGFGGVRASSATLVTTKAAIIAGANNGGVFAALGWGHAVSIVHANPRMLDVVDDGALPPMTWADFYTFYDTAGSELYALTWAARDTQQVTFDGGSTTSGSVSMAPQVEKTGSTEALDQDTFVNDGYSFQGWSTKPTGPAQYANGANYTFTKGATLYAIYTYTGVSY